MRATLVLLALMILTTAGVCADDGDDFAAGILKGVNAKAFKCPETGDRSGDRVRCGTANLKPSAVKLKLDRIISEFPEFKGWTPRGAWESRTDPGRNGTVGHARLYGKVTERAAFKVGVWLTAPGSPDQTFFMIRVAKPLDLEGAR